MRIGPIDVLLCIGAIAFMVLSIVLGYIVFHVEGDNDTTIVVDEVYFVMKHQGGSTSTIEITVFISNVGENDINELLIRAFSIETGSNLAKDDASITINDVKERTTAEGNLTVVVPNRDRYRIELLVFREGKLDIRGSGTIDLTSIGTATDYRTYPDEGGAGDATVEGMAASPFALLCLLFIVAPVGLIVLILIIVYATKSKKSDTRSFQPMEGATAPPPSEVSVKMDARELTKDGRSERSLEDRVTPYE
jgi:acyl-coenzyme A thioesterase PaaI-like protein